MLQVKPSDAWIYVYMCTICFVLAGIFFAAYRNPQQNRVTRFIQWYLGRKYITGPDLSARTKMMTISIICFSIGVLGLLMWVLGIGTNGE
jgi:hypothetical protein